MLKSSIFKDQCGDTTETLQAPDDGCINVRNMLSIEEVKQNIITSDTKLVSYPSNEQCMFLYCELLAASLYSVSHLNLKNKTWIENQQKTHFWPQKFEGKDSAHAR